MPGRHAVKSVFGLHKLEIKFNHLSTSFTVDDASQLSAVLRA